MTRRTLIELTFQTAGHSELFAPFLEALAEEREEWACTFGNLHPTPDDVYLAQELGRKEDVYFQQKVLSYIEHFAQ